MDERRQLTYEQAEQLRDACREVAAAVRASRRKHLTLIDGDGDGDGRPVQLPLLALIEDSDVRVRPAHVALYRPQTPEPAKTPPAPLRATNKETT
jgi:hypothetical protein